MLIRSLKLESVQPFCQPELKELFDGMNGMMENNVPPENPVVIPFGQMARITGTFKLYHDLLVDLTALGENDPETDLATFMSVAKKAKGLLTVGPPVTSRIIIPK